MPRLTEAELAARLNGMGSTDVVEVCTDSHGQSLAPWEDAGPWRVFNTKVGITPQSSASTPEQEWGHVQEKILRTWYSEQQIEPVIVTGLHVAHPDHPWLWATLDGYTTEGRNVECKNVGSPHLYRHWDTNDADGIPHYVRAQVQIGMACSGRKECDVVAGIGGRPPHVWTVAYDAELAGMLIERGRRFWGLVQEYRASVNPIGAALDPPLPLIDSSDAVRDYLRARYPKDERPMQIATPEVEIIGQTRAASAHMVKQHSVIIKECDAQLMAKAGDSKGWEGDGWKFAWKVNKAGKRATRFTGAGESDE